jgi:hypothetical protein
MPNTWGAMRAKRRSLSVGCSPGCKSVRTTGFPLGSAKRRGKPAERAFVVSDQGDLADTRSGLRT